MQLSFLSRVRGRFWNRKVADLMAVAAVSALVEGTIMEWRYGVLVVELVYFILDILLQSHDNSG